MRQKLRHGDADFHPRQLRHSLASDPARRRATSARGRLRSRNKKRPRSPALACYFPCWNASRWRLQRTMRALHLCACLRVTAVTGQSHDDRRFRSVQRRLDGVTSSPGLLCANPVISSEEGCNVDRYAHAGESDPRVWPQQWHADQNQTITSAWYECRTYAHQATANQTASNRCGVWWLDPGRAGCPATNQRAGKQSEEQKQARYHFKGRAVRQPGQCVGI
jgi:hypothetical protein